MLFLNFSLIFLCIFCLLSNVLSYCPACEQNNNFMNLMNSIRAGNYGNNGNVGNGGGGQNYGSSNYNLGNNGFSSTAAGNSNNNFNIVEGYSNNNGGSSQWTAQPISGYNGFGSTNSNGLTGISGISGISTSNGNNNGFGINGFTSNGNSNFNAIPVRIITTGGGYGCCNMNSFGPCCQPQQQQQTFTQPQTFNQPQSFNTFIPTHSSFGGVQASPANDVPGPIPHASYSPPTGLSSTSATISSQQSPAFDYSSTVQNNVPFQQQQPLQQKQNDATTITSATFDFYPQQHVNTNQYLPSSPYQSQQQQQPQQTQEHPYFKNPYGSAAF